MRRISRIVLPCLYCRRTPLSDEQLLAPIMPCLASPSPEQGHSGCKSWMCFYQESISVILEACVYICIWSIMYIYIYAMVYFIYIYIYSLFTAFDMNVSGSHRHINAYTYTNFGNLEVQAGSGLCNVISPCYIPPFIYLFI